SQKAQHHGFGLVVQMVPQKDMTDAAVPGHGCQRLVAHLACSRLYPITLPYRHLHAAHVAGRVQRPGQRLHLCRPAVGLFVQTVMNVQEVKSMSPLCPTRRERCQGKGIRPAADRDAQGAAWGQLPQRGLQGGEQRIATTGDPVCGRSRHGTRQALMSLTRPYDSSLSSRWRRLWGGARRSRRAITRGSRWAPPTGSLTARSMRPSSLSWGAVMFSASAATGAFSELRHRIEAQPSGEITE